MNTEQGWKGKDSRLFWEVEGGWRGWLYRQSTKFK
jgi:hypothetical protein